MNNRKILTLVSSMMVLLSGLTLSLSIYANAESESKGYTSTDTANDGSTEDLEGNEEGQDEDTLDTSDELQLLKYTDFPQDFIDKVVVVGDSIASGFSSFDRLPQSQVLATGSVGARNIHDFSFTVGDESMDILDALSIKQPQYIFMSMGMNDINLSSSDTYVEDYTKNINDILSICPKSTIVVMGITPVIYYSDFTSNDSIDTYNDALKVMVKEFREGGQKVYYINVSAYLKDEQNGLKSELSSGDGIHLSSSAYDYIFTSMMNSLNWIQ